MAYRDSHGRITIDEDAANDDIRKMNEAECILRAAVEQLAQLQTEAEQFEGETARALAEKAQELRRQAITVATNLEETQHYVRKVVHHYHMVDEQCKAMLAAQAAARKALKRG